MIYMNIIYLDTLFFVNFICDYVIFLCSAKVSGIQLHRAKYCIASVLGGIYACICALYANSWVNLPIAKIIAMILLCFIAFGKENHFILCCLSFSFISFMLCGLISSLTIHTPTINIIPIRGKQLVFAFGAVYILLELYFRNTLRFSKAQTHSIVVIQNNNRITLTALKDTGNHLYDPVTNAPIVICQTSILPSLFPEHFKGKQYSDSVALFNELSSIPSITNKVKLIPYQTIGEKGLLAGFKPDVILLDQCETEMILAFSLRSLCNANHYQAIY